MNIAIFTNNYLPNPYGISMSIESFRKEFEKRGHTVYVFAPKFKGYVDENKNVFRYPSIDLTFKDIHFPIAIPLSFAMSKILKNLEIDVIHSQHPNLLGWAAKHWAKKKNVRLVFTWHTLYNQYAHFAPIIPERLAAWWTIRNAVGYANTCDQVVVPTPSVKKIIQNWGVTNENIVAIPTGVDEKEFANADGKDVRKKYGIASDDVLTFFIGRITAEKNMEFLMRSIAIALEKNDKLKFLVCGGGDQIENMKKIAKENGVSEKVIFTGLVPYEDRKNYFAASDFFVYSSKSETQGMIISEAMYMGLPVVALNATGVKDMVKNHETGILVEENIQEFVRAIKMLAENQTLSKEFSLEAKRVAKEQYTAVVSGHKMLEVYKKAIKRKK